MKKIISLMLLISIISSLMIFPALSEGEENLLSGATITSNTKSADTSFLTDGLIEATSSSQCTQTRTATYFLIDFGKETMVNTLELYEFNNYKTKRLYGYKVETSQDGEKFKQITALDEENALCTEDISEKLFKGTITFDTVNTRYLKLTVRKAKDITDPDKTSVGYTAELIARLDGEIITTTPEEPEFENLALSCEVVPLTTRSSNDHLLVNDGEKNVSKHSEGWQVRKESYVRFDFGQMASFNKIDIYEINTNKVRRLKGYKVEVSQNASEWETLVIVDAENDTCPERIDDTHFKGTIEFEKVTARFVKVTILKAEDPSENANKNIGYVEEIEIFDTFPDEMGRVIEGSTEVVLPQDVKTEIKPVDYSGIMEMEHEWFLEQQIHLPGALTDGAFVRNKNHPQKHATTDKTYYTIEPYFATLGCLGLLDIPDSETITAVKKWIDWYIRNINREPDKYGIKGTIYTRNVNANDYSDSWSTDDYSASDSRGTTFMLLVDKLYRVSGDKEFLKERKADVELILDSALFTMREDGLTDAKNQEGHYTKYLQDNIQVLMALKAMTSLEAEVFGDFEKSTYYGNMASKTEKAVEGLWMEDKGEYIYYITPNKTRLCDWTVFYGDAVSEVFPILYETIEPDSERAIHLYKRFNTEQPKRVVRPKETDFPWMATAIISAKMNDIERVNEHLATMQERYMENGRKWPWYIFESGNAIRAAKEAKLKTNIALLNKNESPFTDGKLETIGSANEITIDLGNPYAVNTAILKADSDYKLSYSEDGSSYTLLGSAFEDVFSFNTVNARYFKFEITSGTAVREAELYYNPVNLSAKKSVSASTALENAENAVDNSTATKWLSNVEEKPYIVIDLGTDTKINEGKILWDYYNYPEKYSLSVSPDNVNYEKVSTFEAKGGNEHIAFPEAQARYVKIESEASGKKAMGIFEILLYNTPKAEITPVNDNDLYKIFVNEVKVSFDVAPLNREGRLLVPFRAICEALGMTVDWNGEERKVTAKKGDALIEMIIDNPEVFVNGNKMTIDVAPTIYNSRTLVPLRFLAEATGYNVGWDGETMTVTIVGK